jgi:hypothetical protein
MKIAQFIDNGRIRLGLVLEKVLQPIDFDGDMKDFLKIGGPVLPFGRLCPYQK